MIGKIISGSIRNRFIVLLIAAVLLVWGIRSMQTTAIDAIPDLSEKQVIVFTEWMGRSPQTIEDQITYPLVTNLQGLPEVKYVRASSMFGMSFIYLIFEDNADLYEARSRVLERLNYAGELLPEGIRPTLGPDGTGVGHILWYTLEAPDMDAGERRAVQDWYVRFGLQNVPGVSEVASFGGFSRQYEISADPGRMNYYGLSFEDLRNSVRQNNNETGGRKFEMSGTGYIIKTGSYLNSVEDIKSIPLKKTGTDVVRVSDVATVQISSEARTGIFDLNGEGETVGGIVVMRYGANADKVIRDVKKQMESVAKGFPKGMTFNIVYDRSELIGETISSVRNTLIEEMIVVALVVIAFLFHWRSALSILIQIPVTIATSFILLKLFEIESNIMSLTGIALAIGVIVDNGIIMAENAYKHLSERYGELNSLPVTGKPSTYNPVPEKERLSIIERASRQVSRGVFFSTVIIIASFLPVFLLTGQEGKLFHPLAWTKTFILVVDAILVITLAPVLMSFFMKGKFRKEEQNPLTGWLEKIYGPVVRVCLRNRRTTIAVNIAAVAVSIPLLMNMGREFMPPLDEQSILFMPVTLPDISNTEAKRILQIQDKVIKSVPEVKTVLGKAGRASTATDNSPISMIETIIMLKPKSEWREGLTKQDIIAELDRKLQIPGVVNGWTQPIINRINMLATGIRTDAGIKVFGQNPDSIQAVSERVKNALQNVPGVEDLYAESLTGGRYLTIEVDRDAAGRYGLTIDEINMSVEMAFGGVAVTQTVEGRRRFPVSVRLAQEFRDNPDDIRGLLLKTPGNGTIPLSAVATIKLEDGPAMISSENALLRGAVLFNVRGRDLAGTIEDAMETLQKSAGNLPQGYFLEWSGQYENLIRSNKTLVMIIPVVILVIFLSLYLAFHSVRESLLSLITIPFALTGGVFMVWFYGVNLSVAVAVGFIALFGIAVETGVVMVIYLNDAMLQLVKRKEQAGEQITNKDLEAAVMHGAAKRLRPKLMTVCVALFGLIPVLWSSGAGSDVMIPIVLPMIGGVLTSSTHILLVTPLIFLMAKEYELKKFGKPEVYEPK